MAGNHSYISPDSNILINVNTSTNVSACLCAKQKSWPSKKKKTVNYIVVKNLDVFSPVTLTTDPAY